MPHKMIAGGFLNIRESAEWMFGGVAGTLARQN